MEQTLTRVGTSHQRELAVINEKLQLSLEDLEQAQVHRESLNNQVKHNYITTTYHCLLYAFLCVSFMFIRFITLRCYMIINTE